MSRTRDIAPMDVAAGSYRSGAAISTTPRSARIQPNSEIMTPPRSTSIGEKR